MNPVYNAVNKPLLVFRIERKFFLAIMLIAVLTFWFQGLVAAAVVYFVLTVVAIKVTRGDRRLPEILWHGGWRTFLRLRQVYDPMLRQ